jgi:hypothetical protein
MPQGTTHDAGRRRALLASTTTAPPPAAARDSGPIPTGDVVLWTPQRVAEQIGASVSALAKGRMGIGPLATLRYVRLGARRVAYRPADVQAWIETRLTRSTAEAKAQRRAGA